MRLCVALILCLFAAAARAEDVRVAAASSLLPAIEDIAERFHHETGHTVQISAASTGVLYAQIVSGAPFDVLIAADGDRPARLLRDGMAERVQTIAYGRLVLWSPERIIDPYHSLSQAQRIAIANPDLAPYGVAARQVLTRADLWRPDHIVMGQNASHTMMLAGSGSVDLAFLAAGMTPPFGATWPVPPTDHAPILHDAALVRPSDAAVAFFDFLASPPAREALIHAGYAHE